MHTGSQRKRKRPKTSAFSKQVNFEFDNREEMALYYEVSDVLRKMIEYQDRQFLLDENNQRKAVAEVYKASCSLAKWLRHDHEYGRHGEDGRPIIRKEV